MARQTPLPTKVAKMILLPKNNAEAAQVFIRSA